MGDGKGKCRRILALKPNGRVLPFIHASTVRAFRALGVEVREMSVPDDADKIKTFLKSPNTSFDVGFVLDMGGSASFIQNFKEIQVTLKIPWIIWFVDDPEGYGFPGSCDPEWTRVFCWDREIARLFSVHGNWKGDPVEHLPLAADPEIFFPGDLPADLKRERGIFAGSTRHENLFLDKAAASVPGSEDTEEKIWRSYSRDLSQPLYDLLWDFLAAEGGKPAAANKSDPLAKLWVHVFAFRIGKRKRVEAVLRLLDGGDVFGDEGWREYLPGDYRGPIDYGTELRGAYERSSFVLDVRQPQSRTGLTQRVFDAGSCGVPVLTEWTPELETLFEATPELASFRTIAEGIGKRDTLLTSIPENLRPGERLRAQILRRHTYAHRARKILEAIRETGL